MNTTRQVIAIVDDEPGQRQLLSNALERAGYASVSCATGAEGIASADACDLMLLDVRLPDISGLVVLERVQAARPGLPVILLTAYIDVRDAVAAIHKGALDYLEKPVDLDELIAAVDDALGAAGRPVTDPDSLALPEGVVAESAAMRAVLREALRAAPTRATVLLLGESGTGKDVVAGLIHALGPCPDGPLVRVNCGALPETLIESELFGHEKGAFTGADAAREGRFGEARGGTLFLDEVGELPLALQPKLLHVLENGSYRRVGGDAERHTDARLVAATNRDLAAQVSEGRFREDLFFRLNVFPVVLPPLRERTDDILPLAALVLEPNRKRMSPAAERLLLAHSWPGNVRELRNALERAVIMSDGPMILPCDLPPQVRDAPPAPGGGQVLVGDMQEIQRRAILEALEKTGGNKTRAATLLNISRRNLIYKLREYGL